MLDNNPNDINELIKKLDNKLVSNNICLNLHSDDIDLNFPYPDYKKFIDFNKNKNLQTLLEKDIYATNIYTLGFNKDSWSNLDYTKKIVTK